MDLNSTSSNVNRMSTVSHAYDPSAGEADTKASLGFAGFSAETRFKFLKRPPKQAKRIWCSQPLIPAVRRQKEKDLCELEATLVYAGNSRPARAITKTQNLKKILSKSQVNKETELKLNSIYSLKFYYHVIFQNVLNSPLLHSRQQMYV